MKLTMLLLLPLFSLSPFPALAKNEKLLAEIVELAKTSESDSLVVIENGKTVYEDHFGSHDELRNIQSITKSITGLALGILVEEGKIESFDVPMSRWLPEWASDPAKSKITLKMVMSHTSGISDSSVVDFFKNPDVITVARNVQPTVEPGSRFEYCNVAVSLLQKAVADASGKTVEEFVKERIFSPLGIKDFFWKKDQTGHELMSGGLSLRTADLVRIGQLVLGQGTLGGHRIIGEATLKALFTKSQTYQDYGLLWWLATPSGSTDPMNYQIIRAQGYGGQYIFIYPTKRLIVVRTKDPKNVSEEPEANTRQHFYELRKLVTQWE